MTLKQLEAFYWAATCSSFAMAAERVHLSVSSLSKRIAELEASLGQVLFDRAGHRAALTEAGTRLLPLAGGLLQQADRLQQEMGSTAGLRGPMREGLDAMNVTTVSRAAVRVQMRSPLPYTVNRPFASRRHSLFSSKNNTVQKCSISIRSPLRYTAGRL